MKRVHRGNIDLDDLSETVVEHINEQIPLFDACIQRIEMLKMIPVIEINRMKKLIVDLGDQHNLTVSEKRLWYASIDEERSARPDTYGTAYCLVLALSRSSTKSERHGRDLELDEVAGSLATPDKRDKGDIEKTWKRRIDRADSLSDDKVNKVFETPVL